MLCHLTPPKRSSAPAPRPQRDNIQQEWRSGPYSRIRKIHRHQVSRNCPGTPSSPGRDLVQAITASLGQQPQSFQKSQTLSGHNSSSSYLHAGNFSSHGQSPLQSRCRRLRRCFLLLMIYILHDLKNPKLWELWYIPCYGKCRI